MKNIYHDTSLRNYIGRNDRRRIRRFTISIAIIIFIAFLVSLGVYDAHETDSVEELEGQTFYREFSGFSEIGESLFIPDGYKPPESEDELRLLTDSIRLIISTADVAKNQGEISYIESDLAVKLSELIVFGSGNSSEEIAYMGSVGKAFAEALNLGLPERGILKVFSDNEAVYSAFQRGGPWQFEELRSPYEWSSYWKFVFTWGLLVAYFAIGMSAFIAFTFMRDTKRLIHFPRTRAGWTISLLFMSFGALPFYLASWIIWQFGDKQKAIKKHASLFLRVENIDDETDLNALVGDIRRFENEFAVLYEGPEVFMGDNRGNNDYVGKSDRVVHAFPRQSLEDAQRAWSKLKGEYGITLLNNRRAEISHSVARKRDDLKHYGDALKIQQKELGKLIGELGAIEEAVEARSKEDLLESRKPEYAAQFSHIVETAPHLSRIAIIKDRIYLLFENVVSGEINTQLGSFLVDISPSKYPAVNVELVESGRKDGRLDYLYSYGSGGFCFGSRTDSINKHARSGEFTAAIMLISEAFRYVNKNDRENAREEFRRV